MSSGKARKRMLALTVRGSTSVSSFSTPFLTLSTMTNHDTSTTTARHGRQVRTVSSSSCDRRVMRLMTSPSSRRQQMEQQQQLFVRVGSVSDRRMMMMMPRRSYFGSDGPKVQNPLSSSSLQPPPSRQQQQQQQQKYRNQQKQRTSRSSTTPTRTGAITSQSFRDIKDAQQQMQQLLNVLSSSAVLPSPSSSSSGSSDDLKINDWTANFGVADLAATDSSSFSSNSSIGPDSTSIYEVLMPLVDQLENDVDSFQQMLVDAVNNGVLNPSRKHAKEISKLVECIISLYRHIAVARAKAGISADTSNGNSQSLSRKCSDVLRTLSSTWNLDIHNMHYEHAIVVANCERNWKQAVHWFDQQIDPSLSLGGTGTPSSSATSTAKSSSFIADPHGLYATAKYSMSSSSSTKNAGESVVVEHVFDAVQRLAMISQHDEASYLLAAGNALGYAGAWKEAVEYLQRSSYDADNSVTATGSLDQTFSYYTLERVGLPIVASIMQVCLLCERPDQAWKIFERYILDSNSTKVTAGHGGYGGEWHWGGQKDGMDPLCRDLGMRAISAAGVIVKESSGQIAATLDAPPRSSLKVALDLYQQCIDERLTISKEAFKGVIETCEQFGDWKSASRIMMSMLDNASSYGKQGNANNKATSLAPSFIVNGKFLSIVEYDGVNTGTPTVPIIDFAEALASAMRVCNGSSNFGLSLTLLRIFEHKLPKSSNSRGTNTIRKVGDPVHGSSLQALEKSILRFLIHLDDKSREEVLTATMVALCGRRCYRNAINLFNEATESHAGTVTGSSKIAFEYALSNEKHHGTIYVGNPWMSAFWHINKLIEAVNLIQKKKDTQVDFSLTRFEHDLLQQGLARTMNSCTDSHDPYLSLLLLEWVDNQVFLDSSQQNQQRHLEAGRFNDAVTAEIIKSLRWTKDFSSAIVLLESTIEKFGGAEGNEQLKNWKLTIEAGLGVLVTTGRGSDAYRIFQSLPEDVLTTDCFSAIGAHLVKQSQWEEVIDLYRQAIEGGFTSEELGLHAMTAVTSTRIENRMRVLRAVVDECADDVGLDAKTWTETRYWQIKRTLGFNYARLLMWWNDPNRAPVDELILAIKQFRQSQKDGLRPKNDICRAIVSGVTLFESPLIANLEGYYAVPRTADQWATLLNEIIKETEDAPIRYDPNFVDDMVVAFRKIGRSLECVKYVDTVMHVDGTRIRKKTLREVQHAARDQHATEMIHNVDMMLSKEQVLTSKA